MKSQVVAKVVERLVWYLRSEGIYILDCEIREKARKYEIFLKPDRNAAGLRFVKVELEKSGRDVKVFTGKTGFDLRVKRFVLKEIDRLLREDLETTSQEEDTGSS